MFEAFVRSSARLMAAVALGAVLSAAPAAAQNIEGLKIIAPAGPGGGWDQTARALQDAMQQADAASNVQVTNIPGAGGTIGLAQFVTGHKGDGKALMVNGLVMVGAIMTNKSAVTLDQITPIARLTGEYLVIVVPAQSDIQTMADLVAKLRDNPGAVSWAGGSAGGTDHILVGLIAKAAGVDPKKVNYVPFSGGGEALAALLGNHVSAGVSGYGEFEAQIKAGKLRAIALSSPERVAGIDVPTLKEQGVEIDLVNWRAVVAPPGLTPEQKATLIQAVEKTVRSESWKNTLESRNWMDLYLPGDDFAKFLKNDQERVKAVLTEIGLIQ